MNKDTTTKQQGNKRLWTMDYGLWTTLFLLFVLSGCGESYYFSETRDFPKSGWAYADSLDFKVPVMDTLKRYDLLLDMEHSDEYLSQNIYLYITTTLPSGKRLGKQLNVDLADKLGVWQGECSGSTCSVRVNLQRSAYFNVSGDYGFSIKQYMRTDTLEGIYSVALRLKEVMKE